MELENKNLNKIMVILRGLGLIFLYVVLSPLILKIFLSTPLKNSFIGLNLLYLMAELVVLAILLFLKKEYLEILKISKKTIKNI